MITDRTFVVSIIVLATVCALVLFAFSSGVK